MNFSADLGLTSVSNERDVQSIDRSKGGRMEPVKGVKYVTSVVG